MTFSATYYGGGVPAWHQSSPSGEIQLTEISCAPHSSSGSGDALRQVSPRKSNDCWVRTLELGQTVGFALEQARRLHDGTKKRPSLRRLAEESGASVSSVWRAYRCHLLAELYPELWYFEALGVAHVAQVLGLKDPMRIALLRRAERLCWSRRELKRAVSGLKAAPPAEEQLHREFALELSLSSKRPGPPAGSWSR